MASLGVPKIAAVVALATSLSFIVESVCSQPTDPRDPFYQARKVFVGTDRDMPLDGTYLIAIQPKLSATGQVMIPTSIIASLREMQRALPHWFLWVLKDSRGDHECGVAINNIGYSTLITAWMWMNWVRPAGSPLMAEFERLGAAVKNELSLRNGLINGLCELVKTDNENRAMEYLTAMARIELTE